MPTPYLTRSRLMPIRRLAEDECRLLEFAGPLLLARREHRFVIGPWRPGTDLLVIRPHDGRGGEPEVVMVTSAAALRTRGLQV